MGPLTRTTAPVTHRVGGDPSHDRRSPGLTTYNAVTLERGVTHDTDFEAWANKVSSLSAPGISLPDFRKDIIIDLFNEADQLVISYHMYRCWVSEYTALPTLDAATAAVAIQTIKLETEGWERDTSVTEPKELSV
jgi:phage tail-like protein